MEHERADSRRLLLATCCPHCGQPQGFHHVVPGCDWRFGPVACEQCGRTGTPSAGSLLLDRDDPPTGAVDIRIEFVEGATSERD